MVANNYKYSSWEKIAMSMLMFSFRTFKVITQQLRWFPYEKASHLMVQREPPSCGWKGPHFIERWNGAPRDVKGFPIGNEHTELVWFLSKTN